MLEKDLEQALEFEKEWQSITSSKRKWRSGGEKWWNIRIKVC